MTAHSTPCDNARSTALLSTECEPSFSSVCKWLQLSVCTTGCFACHAHDSIPALVLTTFHVSTHHTLCFWVHPNLLQLAPFFVVPAAGCFPLLIVSHKCCRYVTDKEERESNLCSRELHTESRLRYHSDGVYCLLWACPTASHHALLLQQ